MQHQIIKVTSNVQWQIAQDIDSQRWVAACDALRLTVEGETFGETMGTIADALNGLMLDLLREGELREFLSSHGWTTGGPLPHIVEEGMAFDVPFGIIQKAKLSGNSRAAH